MPFTRSEVSELHVRKHVASRFPQKGELTYDVAFPQSVIFFLGTRTQRSF